MSAVIEMSVIRKGYEREDLLNYISRIDQEASGAKGEDYISEQAKVHGYQSDAQMWVDVALELYKETESIISCVMTSLIVKWMDTERYHDFKTMKLPEGDVAVSFIDVA